jgi:hypothetical protein
LRCVVAEGFRRTLRVVVVALVLVCVGGAPGCASLACSALCDVNYSKCKERQDRAATGECEAYHNACLSNCPQEDQPTSE